MLDSDGYRANVGIVLLNSKQQVWWGKRINQEAWQFPQGGIQTDETPTQAMWRELQEETGLLPDHAQIITHIPEWIHYDVPASFISHKQRGLYRGQKQIWFLLQLMVPDHYVRVDSDLDAEFDDWCWCDYDSQQLLQQVIDFKKPVYEQVLEFFSSHLKTKYE